MEITRLIEAIFAYANITVCAYRYIITFKSGILEDGLTKISYSGSTVSTAVARGIVQILFILFILFFTLILFITLNFDYFHHSFNYFLQVILLKYFSLGMM